MAIIALANSKGGCGKTTLSVNISRALPATLVDADPQASSMTAAAAGEAELVAFPIENKAQIPLFINRVLNLAGDGRHVLIDCPASLNETTRSALMIADLCIVPITPSPLDLRAAKLALDTWKEMRDWRGGLPDVLLVPNRVDHRTKQGREIAETLQAFGPRVAPMVSYRMAYVDAAAEGQAVADFAPGSPAALEIEALAETIRSRLASLALQNQPAPHGRLYSQAPASLSPANQSLPEAKAKGWLKAKATGGFFGRLLAR